MNSRKRKQAENAKRKSEKPVSVSDSTICPFCGKSGKSCSVVNSVSSARARAWCKEKNPLTQKNQEEI